MPTFELRKYQAEAKAAIFKEWENVNRTLLVLPTGCGKTIVFAKVAEECVKQGKRVLILAHRYELLQQASDKIQQSTGLCSAVEKAEDTCIDSWYRVTVGSVQTLMREKRLNQFSSEFFNTIIVDECHHCLSDSYQKVLNHFDDAKVLGVTATPDRGDMRNLGQYFNSLAYEYSLPKAIKEGYLSPIKAQTIPLRLDLTGVGTQAGDYKTSDIDTALDPYLQQIAEEMLKYCQDRKTVVFLPLIKTSQKFRDILNSVGFKAAEVNGTSEDRAEILADFDAGKYNVLCNSMLLCLDLETEILTDQGFVKHNQITMKHKIANWNFDGTVFFEEPKEIVHRPLGLDEHMVAINSKTINFRVTNTHRMIVGCGEKNKNWKKISAEELHSGHLLPASGVAEPFDVRVKQEPYRFTKHAVNNTVYHLLQTEQFTDRLEAREEALKRKAERSTLKYLQPNELSLDQCRFIGFWIADGSIAHLIRSGIEYTASQSKTYPHIIDWLDCLFERLPYRFIKRLKQGNRKHNNDYYVWSFSRGTGFGPQKTNGLYEIEPYLKKDGTSLFWGLNEKQFDALVEGYWYGDGFHGSAKDGMPKSIMMSDTNKNWINLLCAIGSVRGWRCNMTQLPKPVNPKHNIQWSLRMIKGQNLIISCKTPINQESYAQENVWCVRTTSKNIITRRNGYVTVMGNTEGWDCPSVDCIVVLRPTKVRSLYCQMVGRGTRICEGKENLLILDFLWHTERHELCRPAHLIASNEEIAQKMTENIEQSACPLDLEEAEVKATEDVVAAREEALAKALAEMKSRKRKLVDPLQFEMSIQAEDLSRYIPAFGWECSPASDKQLKALEKFGIFPEAIDNAGKAAKLLDRLDKRRCEGLTTPKQIRFLESRGFNHVGTWEFEHAKNLIDRIAGNGWRIPKGIEPNIYVPIKEEW